MWNDFFNKWGLHGWYRNRVGWSSPIPYLSQCILSNLIEIDDWNEMTPLTWFKTWNKKCRNVNNYSVSQDTQEHMYVADYGHKS